MRGGVRLVAPDVEVAAGGERGEFTEDVVHEVVREVLADAQRAEADLGAGVERGRHPVAVQLGVGGEGGVGVPRHVDLGDHLQVAGGGIADDLRVVRLGVVAAGTAADLGGAAVGGQARPGVDGEAPALVVADVQVELVVLVAGDAVDVALDLVDAEEVPGDVEHGAAPGVARGVLDGAARDRPGTGLCDVLLHGGGQQLTQGLDPVEEPGGLARADGDAGAAAVEAVALVAVRSLGQAQLYAAVAVGGDGEPVSGGGPQEVREVVADAAGLARVVDADVGAAGDAVRRAAGADRGRGRDHLVERGGLGGRPGVGRGAGGHGAGRRDQQQRSQQPGDAGSRSVVPSMRSHVRSLR
ncbi:hypothetical protein STENM223S_02638 [Streptomyces tendae]